MTRDTPVDLDTVIKKVEEKFYERHPEYISIDPRSDPSYECSTRKQWFNKEW
jgi:hypothetical protein